MASKRPTGPITNGDDLKIALDYIAERATELAHVALKRDLRVDTICFFAHNQQEYDFLEKAVLARGPVSKFTHGVTLYVDSDFTAAGHHIRIFGVRQPESDRPEIGYGDYPVDDYAALLEETRTNPYANEIITGRGEPLIELKHPDFDVRGYVVDSKDHE